MKGINKKVTEDTSLPSRERFLARYKSFGDYYITLLCLVGVSAAAAVGIALFSNILIGLALAVLCAVVYIVCSRDEAKKQLGLSCTHVTGAVHIRSAKAVYGDWLIIPKRFELADVTHICDCAFAGEKNSQLSAVCLPVGITYIGKDVFGNNEQLPEIRFEGTSEQWDKIEKHTDLSGVAVLFCCEHPVLPKKNTSKNKTDVSKNGGVTQ